MTPDSKRLLNLVFLNKDRLNFYTKKFNAKNLRVFGSVANGTANKLSDIDFLISSNSDMLFPNIEFLKICFKKTLNEKIDIVYDKTINNKDLLNIKDIVNL